MKKIILITAPIFSVSGYGKKSKDIVSSVIKNYANDYDIKIITNNWGNNPNEIDVNFSQYIVTSIETQPHIYIHIGLPNEMQRHGTLYNILFTSSIETNVMDISWINGANQADLTIVPSEFAKQSLIDTVYLNQETKSEIKFNKTVEVLFEGVDTNLFKILKQSEIIDIDLSQIKEKFCFLFTGQWTQGSFGNDRKNIGNLIKTFCETFKTKVEKPALILKTNMGNFSKIDYYKCLEEIESIKKQYCPKNSPNIYLLHGQLSDTQMNQLYNHPKVKVFVSLTRGEGYNRVPSEFGLIGKPMILSNYSGHLDYLKKEYVSLVEGNLTQVDYSALVPKMIIEGSKWFSPNLEHASKIMKSIYENYGTYTNLSQILKRHIETNFSMNVMDTKLKQIFDNYVPRIAELKLPKFLQ
jgi:hypothetical protein